MSIDAQPATAAERLALIKAERARLAAQLTDLTAESAEEREIAKAELDLANERAILAAHVKFNGPPGEKWDYVPTRLGVVIVKRAGDLQFKKWQEDPKYDFDSLEAFVAPCVEYPNAAGFAKLYAELPGVVGDLSLKINTLMGVRAAENAKK